MNLTGSSSSSGITCSYKYWVVMILVLLLCGEIIESRSNNSEVEALLPMPSSAAVVMEVEETSISTSSSNGKILLNWNHDMAVDLSHHHHHPPTGSESVSGGGGRIIVVDKNGKGDSLTVQDAVDMVPLLNRFRHKIYIRPGIYREKVHVPKSKPFISLIGEVGKASETVITWHDKASDKAKDGTILGTYRSASITVSSDYFCATHLTFQNTVVSLDGTNNMQGVALRLKGDKAWLHKVRILGTQDTLLDESGLHFYDQCFIQGSVDFICGNAKSLFQGCTLNSVAKGSGAVAAHRRGSRDEDTGFSFVNCNITGTGSIYLGRAWGSYARIIYSYSFFDKVVDPKGWNNWGISAREKTAEFGECQCRGEGANREHRVPWSRSYTFLEAQFTSTTEFIFGRKWLDPTANEEFPK